MGELSAGTPLRLDELAARWAWASPIAGRSVSWRPSASRNTCRTREPKVLDFDVDELRDLSFPVQRLALESLAVRRAAERFTDAILEAARGHLGSSTSSAARAMSARRCARTRTSISRCMRRRRHSWLVSLIRPAWDQLRRFSALPSSHRRATRKTCTAPSTSSCSPRCAALDPQAAAQALYEHLELASVFFKDELRRPGHLRPALSAYDPRMRQRRPDPPLPNDGVAPHLPRQGRTRRKAVSVVRGLPRRDLPRRQDQTEALRLGRHS